MQEIAKSMLLDLLELGRHRPGILHKAKEFAEDLGISLQIQTDPLFEALFPSCDDTRQSGFEDKVRSVQEIAGKWLTEDPHDVAKRVATLEKEAASVDERNRLTFWLCDELAKSSDAPTTWIRAFLDEGLTGDLVEPFLVRAASNDATEWETVAIECLNRDNVKVSAISVILSLNRPSQRVLNAALRNLGGLAKQVEFLCARNRVPIETIRCLLRNDDDAVASHAAVRVWVADPKGEVADEIRADWQQAVLRCGPEEYWLGEMFRQDRSLACAWLAVQFQRVQASFYADQHATKTALEVLTRDQRAELLKAIPADCWNVEIVTQLIGDDTGLYRHLLEDTRLGALHLAPLTGRPDQGNWVEKATMALEFGSRIEDVAHAPFHGPLFWEGNASDMWKKWINAFEAIRSNPDERIKQTAEAALEYVNHNYERALRQERDEETYGRP
jgi:hypothetical protein